MTIASKQIVDWKLFEIQSLLISDDVDPEDIRNAVLWLQPRHYKEVIEERSNDDRCGYPLCTQMLNASNNQHDECMEKSLIVEQSLSDMMPQSRNVAYSLGNAKSVSTSIDDFLNVAQPSKVSVPDAQVSDNDLPYYRNVLLSNDGKVLKQSVFNDDCQPTFVEDNVAMKDLLISEKKSAIPNECFQVGIDEKKTRLSSQCSNSSLNASVVEIQGLKEKHAVQGRQNLKNVEANSIERKAVRFQISSNDDDDDDVRDSVLSDSKNSNNTGTAPKQLVAFPRTDKLSHRIMSKLVVERTDPKPLSHRLMRENVPNYHASSMGVGDIVTSDTEHNLIASDDIIDNNIVSELHHVKVAPHNSVKSLSHDPFNNWRKSADTQSPYDPVIEEIAGDCDYEIDNDSNRCGSDTSSLPEEDVQNNHSLFLSVWSALDDLFSNALLSFQESACPIDNSVARDETEINSLTTDDVNVSTERCSMSIQQQQIHQSIIILLERGVKTAEKSLDVNRILSSSTNKTQYTSCKNQLLSNVNLRLSQCPSLRSCGWTLIGVLLVDAIMVRRGLLMDGLTIQSWTEKVEGIAVGLLRGGQFSDAFLREGDLRILRTFFEQL